MGTEVQPRRTNPGAYTPSVPIFLLVAILGLASFSARADSLISENWPYNEIGPVSLIVGGLGGFSTSLLAFIDIGQNKKPSKLTLVGSGIFGVLNSIAGVGYLATSDKELVAGLGVTHLALGVVGLSATIWGGLMENEEDLKVSPLLLPPIPGADVDSSAFGIAVSGRF